MQVDYADIERLGDEIAELSAHLEAATARLLDRIREFDERGGWNNGFRSCAEWLSWRVGLDRGAAREKVRVARSLAHLPLLRAALARGEISYAKVRAVTRVATPDNEDRLLKLARAGTSDHVEKVVRGWRRVDRRAELDETKRQHVYRSLQVYPDDDGIVIVRGRLTPEAGALLMRALEAARDELYRKRSREDDPPSMAQQQADALALLAEAALHHGIDPGTSGERYHVVVHVDAAVLANADHPGQSVLEEGERVSAETSQRLACDASRVIMREDAEGNVVEIGARTRTIPPALRRALQYRDKRCTFPGCHVRIAEGHHIKHWAQGGPTKLSNLSLLCRPHHRAVHEEGFRIERKPDGALVFYRRLVAAARAGLPGRASRSDRRSAEGERGQRPPARSHDAQAAVEWREVRSPLGARCAPSARKPVNRPTTGRRVRRLVRDRNRQGPRSVGRFQPPRAMPQSLWFRRPPGPDTARRLRASARSE